MRYFGVVKMNAKSGSGGTNLGSTMTLAIDIYKKSLIIRRLREFEWGGVGWASSLIVVVHWGISSQSRPCYSSITQVIGIPTHRSNDFNNTSGRFMTCALLN